MTFDPQVEDALAKASAATGVPVSRLRVFTRIESGGRPDAATGSYHGLLQLSRDEFTRRGGRNIYDPYENALIGAKKLAEEAATYETKRGRAPSDADLYLVHQQGAGGEAAHSSRPDAPAWQNMAGTAEGRRRGVDWARDAIWGNVPEDVRAQYPGGVDSLTSGQFSNIWRDKVARMGGEGGAPGGVPGAAVASAPAAAPARDGIDLFGTLGKAGIPGMGSLAAAAAPDVEAQSMQAMMSGPSPGADAEAINRQMVAYMWNVARRGAVRRV
jgi:hypothetical protein